MAVPDWPSTREELVAAQHALARAEPSPLRPGPKVGVAAVFACFAGDEAWAGATLRGAEVVVQGPAGAQYEPGLLALREGLLLEAAVRALAEEPDVLLVNATGRDHPRRAGLALHLGAVLALPTVGITDRPLVAQGDAPGEERGARTPLFADGELVGYRLRTRRGARPPAVHAAWRTDADTAAEVVLAATRQARTPEPMRRARRAARAARAAATTRPWRSP